MVAALEGALGVSLKPDVPVYGLSENRTPEMGRQAGVTSGRATTRILLVLGFYAFLFIFNNSLCCFYLCVVTHVSVCICT